MNFLAELFFLVGEISRWRFLVAFWFFREKSSTDWFALVFLRFFRRFLEEDLRESGFWVVEKDWVTLDALPIENERTLLVGLPWFWVVALF